MRLFASPAVGFRVLVFRLFAPCPLAALRPSDRSRPPSLLTLSVAPLSRLSAFSFLSQPRFGLFSVAWPPGCHSYGFLFSRLFSRLSCWVSLFCLSADAFPPGAALHLFVALCYSPFSVPLAPTSGSFLLPLIIPSCILLLQLPPFSVFTSLLGLVAFTSSSFLVYVVLLLPFPLSPSRVLLLPPVSPLQWPGGVPWSLLQCLCGCPALFRAPLPWLLLASLCRSPRRLLRSRAALYPSLLTALPHPPRPRPFFLATSFLQPFFFLCAHAPIRTAFLALRGWSSARPFGWVLSVAVVFSTGRPSCSPPASCCASFTFVFPLIAFQPLLSLRGLRPAPAPSALSRRLAVLFALAPPRAPLGARGCISGAPFPHLIARASSPAHCLLDALCRLAAATARVPAAYPFFCPVTCSFVPCRLSVAPSRFRHWPLLAPALLLSASCPPLSSPSLVCVPWRVHLPPCSALFGSIGASGLSTPFPFGSFSPIGSSFFVLAGCLFFLFPPSSLLSLIPLM